MTDAIILAIVLAIPLALLMPDVWTWLKRDTTPIIDRVRAEQLHPMTLRANRWRIREQRESRKRYGQVSRLYLEFEGCNDA